MNQQYQQSDRYAYKYRWQQLRQLLPPLILVSVGVENLWRTSLISLFRLQDVAFISDDITTERLADNHNFDPKLS
ncbi:hypothetical protein [Nostoc favosum]|uniref:hypothetical protein n=1 Tax=Nostoc favosum TaxID=2907819 RepID=UPI001E5980EA|nr:hypothetical protein [Nostoc favosum]